MKYKKTKKREDHSYKNYGYQHQNETCLPHYSRTEDRRLQPHSNTPKITGAHSNSHLVENVYMTKDVDQMRKKNYSACKKRRDISAKIYEKLNHSYDYRKKPVRRYDYAQKEQAVRRDGINASSLEKLPSHIRLDTKWDNKSYSRNNNVSNSIMIAKHNGSSIVTPTRT